MVKHYGIYWYIYIISINEFIRFNDDLDLYNLIEPNLAYLDDVPGTEINYKNF
jgi:hypothetical protein